MKGGNATPIRSVGSRIATADSRSARSPRSGPCLPRKRRARAVTRGRGARQLRRPNPPSRWWRWKAKTHGMLLRVNVVPTGLAVACFGAEARVSGAEKNGLKNYMTPGGYRRLHEELSRLWKVERPALVATVAWAAGNGDRSENGDYIYGKRKLREIDRRIRHLSKSLDTALVVDNAGRAPDRVLFGATVTVTSRAGDARVVTIVGVDDLDSGDERVSWRSPLATALLKAKVGDVVTVRTPRGPERVEVVAIRYDSLM